MGRKQHSMKYSKMDCSVCIWILLTILPVISSQICEDCWENDMWGHFLTDRVPANEIDTWCHIECYNTNFQLYGLQRLNSTSASKAKCYCGDEVGGEDFSCTTGTCFYMCGQWPDRLCCGGENCMFVYPVSTPRLCFPSDQWGDPVATFEAATAADLCLDTCRNNSAVFYGIQGNAEFASTANCYCGNELSDDPCTNFQCFYECADDTCGSDACMSLNTVPDIIVPTTVAPTTQPPTTVEPTTMEPTTTVVTTLETTVAGTTEETTFETTARETTFETTAKETTFETTVEETTFETTSLKHPSTSEELSTAIEITTSSPTTASTSETTITTTTAQQTTSVSTTATTTTTTEAPATTVITDIPGSDSGLTDPSNPIPPTTTTTIPPQPTTTEPDDGLSPGAIAGIVIGCVVFVILVIVVPIVVTRKKPKETETYVVNPEDRIIYAHADERNGKPTEDMTL